MAVATAAALVGTGISAIQAIGASKEKNASKRDMENYEVYEPTNTAKDISISSVGADIRREESARTVASLTDVAKSLGARGAYGMLPKIQANANKVNQEIGIDLDKQDINRQQMIARGADRIMAHKEQRDNANIAALSSQYTAANEDFNKGLWGVASGITSFANQFGGFTPQVESVNSGIVSQVGSALTTTGVQSNLPSELPSSFYNRG